MKTPFFIRNTTVASLLFLCCGFLNAQIDSFATPILDTASLGKVYQKINTLQSILETTPDIESTIELKRQEQGNEELTEEEKEGISKEIEQLNHQLDQLKKDFGMISSGIDPRSFLNEVPDPQLDWDTEVKQIFHPYIEELKKITTRPREIERLRSEAAENEEKAELIEDAIYKLKELMKFNNFEDLNANLREQVYYWEEQDEALQTKSDAITLHLEEILNQSQSFSETLSAIFKSFFRGHAKNLFLALLALLGTFFVLRFIHKLIRDKLLSSKSKKWQFLLRAADLLYYIFTIFAAFTFFMMVLYSASDWLLLGISIILLFGMLWVGKNAFPIFIEQAKLLLDLGPVREGERVIYNGIPWVIDTLNFYTYLSNPNLDNSHIILPLRDLIGLRSRPFHEKEPWFPSLVDDYVKLEDGFFGKVISQSPDTVIVEVERGSRKSYNIESYLANNPQNISQNHFTISEVVGIDYKYRNQLHSEICPKLDQILEEQLKSESYGEHVLEVRVELENLNSSSIDLEIFVKFDGAAAAEYVELPGRIQQLTLNGLNQLEIDIPFPHLTITR